MRNEVGKKLRELKCSVRSLNDLIGAGGTGYVPGGSNPGSKDKKRTTQKGKEQDTGKDFVMSPTDALVLRDVLPKVSWIFHLAPPPVGKTTGTNYKKYQTTKNQRQTFFTSFLPQQNIS